MELSHYLLLRSRTVNWYDRQYQREEKSPSITWDCTYIKAVAVHLEYNTFQVLVVGKSIGQVQSHKNKMKFFTVFLLVLVVLSAVFGTSEAGWLKKKLKKVVSVLFKI